jgi:plastocyanin
MRNRCRLAWRNPAPSTVRVTAKEGSLAACFLLCTALGSAAGTESDVHTYTVRMENLQFIPAELSVRRGDRIVWKNGDFFPHTATARDKTFDSGSIDANASWSLTIEAVGDHPYACTFHPTMKGEIHVR